MAEQQLKAESREGAGKGVARKLRAAGRVPAVLNGHGMEPMSLAVDSRELFHVLHTGAGSNVLVDLTVDGKKHLVLAREIQRDHIRNRFLHVDFLAIRRDEQISIDVPVRLVGESPGVKQGGVVEHHLWDLHVECLPGDVPEGIDADISSLEIGDALRVSDLVLPRGVTITTAPEETVVSVVTPQILEVEEEVAEEEEGAEVAEGEGPAAAEGEGAPSEGASEEGGEG
jgi:large subunit ribosomal protein L25